MQTPSAASRDPFLVLRRVERQQWIVERLWGHGRQSLRSLADELGVAERTVARDVRRLRESGVPVTSRRGRGGGVALARPPALPPVSLDVPELAALVASLAAVGPSVSPSAQSAMDKLVAALAGGDG